ncbi:MAG: hypothetical protein HYZ54_06595 [Ignavibacteriae bacterium]|nr:hypothetical protein [Ignavibacteriota bacterium]
MPKTIKNCSFNTDIVDYILDDKIGCKIFAWNAAWKARRLCKVGEFECEIPCEKTRMNFIMQSLMHYTISEK